MFNQTQEYYGDDFRWFVATVINSTPPFGFEGRVRIRVHGIHNPSTGEIGESDLPWAQVMIPLTEGGSSGHGRVPQVLPGALVYGFFLDAKFSQLPIILGSVSKIEYPTDVQAKLSNEQELSVFKTRLNKREQNVEEPEIENDTSEKKDVNEALRRSQAMKFFIDNGYSIPQAAGIVAGLQESSKFVSFQEDDTSDRRGIASWKSNSPRYGNLIKFAGQFEPKGSYQHFSIQLQYVLFELRTTQTIANSKLLRTNKIKGSDGSAQIFLKYYLKRTDISNSSVEDTAIIAEEEVLR